MEPITRDDVLSALTRGSAWAHAREPLTGQGSALDVLAVCLGLPRSWDDDAESVALMRGIVMAVQDTLNGLQLVDGRQSRDDEFRLAREVMAFAYGISMGRALDRPLEEDGDGTPPTW